MPLEIMPQDLEDRTPRRPQEYVKRMKKEFEVARTVMQRVQQLQKIQADKHRSAHEFKAGDYVLLKRQFVKGTADDNLYPRKLVSRYCSPYRITKVVGRNAVYLNFPHTWKTQNPVNVEKLKPYQASDQPKEPLGQWRGKPLYQVEKILRAKKVRGKNFYLVKWKGYSDKDSTWEPESHLKHIPHLLQTFKSGAKQPKENQIKPKK